MVSRHNYGGQSRVFLAQAREELQRDDLRQASEKGWGAAAQVVKATAEARGWPHGSHPLLHATVAGMVEETADREIGRLFGVANGLRVNFYEGGYSYAMVEDALYAVSRFVEKVEELLDR